MRFLYVNIIVFNNSKDINMATVNSAITQCICELLACYKQVALVSGNDAIVGLVKSMLASKTRGG